MSRPTTAQREAARAVLTNAGTFTGLQPLTPADIDDLVDAQAQRADPSQPLSGDELDALGFDSTLRNQPRRRPTAR
ncbi:MULTISPECIES: hypothetical protein [Asanoa]|uniref:Uncharacterized protein n=2 Tax=Asanoa TaxID=195964 RepID=A0A239PGH4_9ACTN|nr:MULTISPECIES: hypothetical protein [Asanoa]GIF74168.1 hypothetical protein Asi02nite_36860 [Asanoa siamensis]SNT65684.1 hypothetical protein SAMN05421812_12527 [Asanoa hainanensis]